MGSLRNAPHVATRHTFAILQIFHLRLEISIVTQTLAAFVRDLLENHLNLAKPHIIPRGSYVEIHFSGQMWKIRQMFHSPSSSLMLPVSPCSTQLIRGDMNPKSKEGEASGVPLIGTGFHGDPTTRGKMSPTWEQKCGKKMRSFIFPSKLKLSHGLASHELRPTLCSLPEGEVCRNFGAILWAVGACFHCRNLP